MRVVRASRGIVAATSERRDGEMGFTDGFTNARILKHRKAFLKKCGVSLFHLARVEQVHGNTVRIVGKKNLDVIRRADGMITRERGVLLGILTADCVPIFFWNKEGNMVGIAHAGWRGVAKNIAARMVKTFRAQGVSPRALSVFLGPSIQKCHFEIWPKTRHKGFTRFLKVHARLITEKRLMVKKGDRLWFDLQGTIREELIRAGVRPRRIRSSGECTFHLPKRFFSYRRKSMGGRDRFGNMISVIGFRG